MSCYNRNGVGSEVKPSACLAKRVTLKKREADLRLRHSLLVGVYLYQFKKKVARYIGRPHGMPFIQAVRAIAVRIDPRTRYSISGNADRGEVGRVGRAG